MADPNSLQHVALNSLRNSLPSGTKLKAFAYAPEPGTVEGKAPTYNAARTTSRDGQEVVEHYTIDAVGRVVQVS